MLSVMKYAIKRMVVLPVIIMFSWVFFKQNNEDTKAIFYAYVFTLGRMLLKIEWSHYQ